MDTHSNVEGREVLAELSGAIPAPTATEALTSFTRAVSRRWVLRGAIAGSTGAVLAGASILGAEASPAGSGVPSSTLTEFFSILATGEALFVTFYSQAIAHQSRLGLSGSALKAIGAILAEEQLHFNLAVSQGGTPATIHFSMPRGPDTFKDRSIFLQTQQLAEELTNGALLAWISDTASMGLPRLAELGGQLMQVEGGHRVVGRVILGADPWDNWAFGPISLAHFTDVPAAVTAAGFLSPKPGNDFEFHPVPPIFPGVINTTPGTL